MKERNKKNIFKELKAFGRKCIRVLRVSRKPTPVEIKQTSKISALGIIAIGIIGFIIGLIFTIISFK